MTARFRTDMARNALLCMSLVLPASARAGGATYVTVPLAGQVRSAVTGLNANNQAVGWFEDSAKVQHDFFWSPTTGTMLIDPPGCVLFNDAAVNSAGKVALGCIESGDIQVKTWDRTTGVFTLLAHGNAFVDTVIAINKKGNVLSQAFGVTNTRAFFVISRPTGTAKLVKADKYPGLYPRGMNDAGAVTGLLIRVFDRVGFIWQSSTLTTFQVGSAGDTRGNFIEADGTVGGSTLDGSIYKGFLRDPMGNVTQFTLPGREGVFPIGRSSDGAIYGNWRQISTSTAGGFRLSGGAAQDLSFPDGGTLRPVIVTAVNARGSFAGTYTDDTGNTRAFVAVCSAAPCTP